MESSSHLFLVRLRLRFAAVVIRGCGGRSHSGGRSKLLFHERLDVM